MVGLASGVERDSLDAVTAWSVAFVLAHSMSWAAGFWVLVSELFSIRSKFLAGLLANSVMFLGGSLCDLLFPILLYAAARRGPRPRVRRPPRAATASDFPRALVLRFAFLSVLRSAELGGFSFLLYAIVLLYGAVFVCRELPETAGLTLDEVRAAME